jgi:hypothetical protein
MRVQGNTTMFITKGIRSLLAVLVFTPPAYPVRIILQCLRVAEAAQHHRLPAPIIDAYLDKEAAAITGAVRQVAATKPSQNLF